MTIHTMSAEDHAAEAAEILRNLIDNIEAKGNYSAETTINFLNQALSEVRHAIARQPQAVEGLEEVGYAAQQDIDWQGDCTLRKAPMLDYSIPLVRLSDAQRLLAAQRLQVAMLATCASNVAKERDQLRTRVNELESRVPLTADDVRLACQDAIEVFEEQPDADQCREVAEYMREVLLARIARLNAKPAADWCPTMQRPKAQCGCPDCGSSLVQVHQPSPANCDICDGAGSVTVGDGDAQVACPFCDLSPALETEA